jgi:hypothetical protein
MWEDCNCDLSRHLSPKLSRPFSISLTHSKSFSLYVRLIVLMYHAISHFLTASTWYKFSHLFLLLHAFTYVANFQRSITKFQTFKSLSLPYLSCLFLLSSLSLLCLSCLSPLFYIYLSSFYLIPCLNV